MVPTPPAPADGDQYVITARTSESGTQIFQRTFAATYQTITVCGTVCKEYDGKQ